MNEWKSVELAGSGGLTLRADVAGPENGAPVLLLHGGGQTRHSWHKTLAALAARGWRAYSVDMRGHGASDWAPDGDYSLDAFASDALAMARSLGRRPVLVGASLGGISALVAVGESSTPVARALVLVDIAPRIDPAGSRRVQDFMHAHVQDGFANLDEVADAIAAYNPHRPRPTDHSGLLKNVRQRADGRWVWHWDPKFMINTVIQKDPGKPNQGPPVIDEPRIFMSGPERLERAARAIRLPTLLVRGRLSDLLSPEGAQDFLRLVPHAELADVAGAGHMIAGDRNDAFNQAILSFLDRLPADSY